MQVGLIGCGAISKVYLRCSNKFANFKIVKCADLLDDYAQSCAEEFGLEAVSVDELFADKDIKLVLNLTPPAGHSILNKRAITAGKHVYSEKPFAVDFEEAQSIMLEAEKRNLYAVSAPDSFLGAAQQYARELIDKGTIGQVFGGCASIMVGVGYHSNHRDISFFFRKGAGPLFDLGPYYIAALVSILGPVERVVSMGGKLSDTRTCLSGSNAGKTFPIEVPSHIQSLLYFKCGTAITLNTSFDVRKHSNPAIELYGENGSLSLGEPSNFGNSVKLFDTENKIWNECITTYPYGEVTRGLGVADLVSAIKSGRKPRCAPDFTLHVLEVMSAIEKSLESKQIINLTTSTARPERMNYKDI